METNEEEGGKTTSSEDYNSSSLIESKSGSALYDEDLSLDNVRTLVYITKTKSVIKTITNNEINIHKRSRNATRVKITNQSLIGRLTLDAYDIDARGKNSLRYKVIKYLIRNPTNVDNFNKQIADNTLNPLQKKLVFSIVSDRLLQLLSDDVLRKIANTHEVVRGRNNKDLTINLFRTFYFGNPREYVQINFDTQTIGQVSVTVNGESVNDYTRTLTKLSIPLRLPAQSLNPYFEKKQIEISFSGEQYQTTVYLISADMNKILSNLLKMELVGINGVRRDHSESLLSCKPVWNIDEHGTFRYYYEYFLEWSAAWDVCEENESLFEFLLQTNAFYVPLGCLAANFTHTNCFAFLMKSMIDIFTFLNEELSCKNPVITPTTRENN